MEIDAREPDSEIDDYIFQIALSLRIIYHNPPLPSEMVDWHARFLTYWGIPPIVNNETNNLDNYGTQ